MGIRLHLDCMHHRLRLHEAVTNFPIEDYSEEVAATEAEREAGRDAEPVNLCQRRREKASRFRGVCLSAGKYVAQITVRLNAAQTSFSRTFSPLLDRICARPATRRGEWKALCLPRVIA